jgi:DNA invertase Pin-like site-specific DNA recombinase
MMNRAIAYILVDGDVGPHAIVAEILDVKKREIVERAATLGLELTAVYADVRREMESGRKGLRAMLSDVERHAVSAVVVESFESFADPHVKMIEAFKSLKDGQARVYVLNENKVVGADQIDLLMRALAMAREYDQKLNAVRIKRGLQHASLSGKAIGRKPFESEGTNSEIFNNVLEMRKRGLSLRDICKALNSARVETSGHKTWHPTTVKRMLERAEHEKL